MVARMKDSGKKETSKEWESINTLQGGSTKVILMKMKSTDMGNCGILQNTEKESTMKVGLKKTDFMALEYIRVRMGPCSKEFLTRGSYNGIRPGKLAIASAGQAKILTKTITR